MSNRLTRLVGVVAVLALVAAGLGSAHGLVRATDKAVDGLGLQPVTRSVLDVVALRGDTSRIERVEGPRNVVERVLVADSHPSLRLPRAVALALAAQQLPRPALHSSAPSLSRAPPASR